MEVALAVFCPVCAAESLRLSEVCRLEVRGFLCVSCCPCASTVLSHKMSAVPHFSAAHVFDWSSFEQLQAHCSKSKFLYPSWLEEIWKLDILGAPCTESESSVRCLICLCCAQTPGFFQSLHPLAQPLECPTLSVSLHPLVAGHWCTSLGVSEISQTSCHRHLLDMPQLISLQSEKFPL